MSHFFQNEEKGVGLLNHDWNKKVPFWVWNYLVSQIQPFYFTGIRDILPCSISFPEQKNDRFWAVNFEILNKIWNFNLIRIPSKVIKNRFHFVFYFLFSFYTCRKLLNYIIGKYRSYKRKLDSSLLNLQKKQHTVEEVGEVDYFKLRKTFECLEKLFTYLFTVFQVWSIVNCVWSARLYQYHILLSHYLEYWQRWSTYM